MFCCGWLSSPSSPVWRGRELRVLGVGLAGSSCGLSSRKGAGPQLYSLLPPSGKIWVLQGMGLQMPLGSVLWSFLAQFADA